MTKSNSIARQGALPQSLSQSLPQSLPQVGEKEKTTKKTTWESVLSVLYPALCLACGEETDKHPGLCSACWGQTHFISGTICDGCGTPLPEVTAAETDPVFCDFCLHDAPSWSQGRAVVLYKERGRNIVLSLKHGDRLDIAKVIGKWMINSGADIIGDCDLIAPVPLHWLRLLRRKFNQSAELARPVADAYGLPYVPDLLVRHKQTKMQKDMPRVERIENLSRSVKMNARFADRVKGKKVLLIDDVMTTGATLRACSSVCLAAGATGVNVLVFARVAGDGWRAKVKEVVEE